MFFKNLPENKEQALENLLTTSANKSTIGAIKAGIIISYGGNQKPCQKN
jgi:hypothetical protein